MHEPIGHVPGRAGGARLRCVVALALLAGLLAAQSAAAAQAPASAPGPPRSVPDRGAGRDSAAVVSRLAKVDYADVSRACGNINSPWAYRGPVGRNKSVKSYGTHRADRAWAKGFAEAMLMGASIDSAWKSPSGEVSCDPKTAPPVYLIRFVHQTGHTITDSGEEITMALVRFDVGSLVLFDAEEPLGLITMGARADTLWAALGRLIEDDPLLRGPRPSPVPPDTTRAAVEYVFVEELPEALKRVAPRYPLTAVNFGIDGMVFLQVLVGADGTVHDALVISGPPVLRDPALEAIWKWKFKPARAGGKPTPVWVAIPVKFSLR